MGIRSIDLLKPEHRATPNSGNKGGPMADEKPPVVPPGVQHVPGSEGSTYVSPNTTKGTKKKDQSEVEEARKKDEVTPDG